MKNLNRATVLFWICLLVSLFIYLFYRGEGTIINKIFQFIFTEESHIFLQNTVKESVPIPSFAIYSLPEGLWVLAATMASANYFISVKNKRIQLIFVPLTIAVILEILQVFKLTNGTFDWLDLMFALLFAITGYLMVQSSSTKQNLFNSINLQSIMCIGSFLVLYMAHVSQ